MSKTADYLFFIQSKVNKPIVSFEALETKLNYLKKQTEIKPIENYKRGMVLLWNKQVKQNGTEIELPFYTLNGKPQLQINESKPITSIQFNVGEYLNNVSVFVNVFYEDKSKDNFRLKDRELSKILEQVVEECNYLTDWYLEQQKPTEEKQKYSPAINQDLLFFQTYTKLNNVDLKVLKSVFDILEEKEIKDKFLETCKAIQGIKQSYIELVNN
jgi:hypothetical protein